MRSSIPDASNVLVLLCALTVACTASGSTDDSGPGTPPAVGVHVVGQTTIAGARFHFDATVGGTAFTHTGDALTYQVVFTPAQPALTVSGSTIDGVIADPGVAWATITATDHAGRTASQSFAIVAFAPDLPAPTLPSALYAYSDARVPLPQHFLFASSGSVSGIDNTPVSNPTTDAGATLGRVLFYDPRLSANDRVACASCHQQQFGFGDTARLSAGFTGGHTRRHAMGLANARFYQDGHFFWDERAATLEAQVLQPIQDAVEMGTQLDNLTLKLELTNYYASLFENAFGTAEVTSDRIARALGQFVRSMVSFNAKYDAAFGGGTAPDFSTLTPQEQRGQQLFTNAGCAACHRTNAMAMDVPRNTGLDAITIDQGVSNGRFKAPALRNIAARPPYMHDGRFSTLLEVVQFYNNGIQPNPNLDVRLRALDGTPMRLGLTSADELALVAFLNTLTDNTFLTAPRFANPFVR